MKYECPNCHAVVHSDKKLEYCVCGWKYEEDYKQMFHDMGLGDIFDKEKK